MDDDAVNWRVIGDGITERRKAFWKAGRKPRKSETILDRVKRLVGNQRAFFADPWAAYREMHAEIVARYDAIRESMTLDELSEQLSGIHERISEAWWLREMVREGNLVLSAIDKGDAALAAYRAFEFSAVVTEYNIALAQGWNRYAKAGRKSIESAESTRKGIQSERVRRVDNLVADGEKKTAAFALVAEEQGVTAKAIETDYYKAKRKAS